MKITARVVAWAVILSIASGAGLGAVGYAGMRIGKAWGRLVELSELTFGTYAASTFAHLPRRRQFILAMEQAFGPGKPLYHSDYGQDQWVNRIVYPDVRNGYYVDVGSGDGVRQSNSKALDDLGWKGICIDPFPTGMQTRTARLFKEVVYSEKGHKVMFRPTGFTGGIEDHFNLTKDWPEHQKAEAVEFVTTTLDDVLLRADAPRFIEYMSIDVEGAELEVLKGLSFSVHRVGVFTIEHNWEEAKRSEIRKLLEMNGYRYAFPRGRDDFYVYSGLLMKPDINDPY